MENAAIQYFRTRYSDIYQRLGAYFPIPKLVQYLVEKKQDVLAPWKSELDEITVSKEDLEEIVDYLVLPNKIEFEPLTVDIAKRNIGKAIRFYHSNGGAPNSIWGPGMLDDVNDRNKRDKVFYDQVIFDSPRMKKDGNHFYMEGRVEGFGWDEIEFLVEDYPWKNFPREEFKGLKILSFSNSGTNWVEKGVY